MRGVIGLRVLLAVPLFAAAAEPQLHGNLAAARAIVDADRHFGALAKTQGTGEAFREIMDATDGVVYGGGAQPAIGRDAIYAMMGGDAQDDTVL